MSLPDPLGATLDRVGVRHGRTWALKDATFEIVPGRITGLLGRNGSGKTTALSLVAAFHAPTRGRVTVGGRDPFDDPRTMPAVCLVRESGDVIADQAVADTLRVARLLRPTWDQARAEQLLDHFGIDLATHPNSLSRGRRSVLGAVIGLASRAPLTIFDEVYLGMDAPTRTLFYERLIADYAENPRTIVLSSHLISEIEQLLEHAIILDRGKVRLAGLVDELTSAGVTVTGAADRVDAAVAGLEVLAERSLGPTKEVAVHGDLDRATVAALEEQGLGVGRLGLQELVIHTTRRSA